MVVRKVTGSRSQWPRGLRRRSAAARLLRSWVRIPKAAWMSVCCECYVLSGRGLCDELITSPEESYRPWCVVVCDLETSKIRRPWPALSRSAKENKLSFITHYTVYPRHVHKKRHFLIENLYLNCPKLYCPKLYCPKFVFKLSKIVLSKICI